MRSFRNTEELLATANNLYEQNIRELKPLLPEAELVGLHIRMAAAIRERPLLGGSFMGHWFYV
jgi:hypothetical protein